MASKKPLRQLIPAPGAELKAQAIAEEELGPGFRVDYFSLPQNTGVMGDAGVRGHTPLISTELGDPACYVAEHPDELTRIVGRIIAETGGACRVLFDITPGGGYFEALSEGGAEPEARDRMAPENVVFRNPGRLIYHVYHASLGPDNPHL